MHLHLTDAHANISSWTKIYSRLTALNLYSIGIFDIRPTMDSSGCLTSSLSRQNVNRWRRLENTRKSSILANGSPRQARGPAKQYIRHKWQALLKVLSDSCNLVINSLYI